MSKNLALYLHFPFCTKKCNYCNFYSIPYDADLIHKYFSALRKEINNFPFKNKYEIVSIYLGGGSPSLIPFPELMSVLNSIHNQYKLKDNLEVTLEANPIQVNASKVKNWKLCGINRVSLGAQSFVDSELQALGRLHASSETKLAVDKIRNHCCNNISLDLMYGLPDQTMESWIYSLREALALSPNHLSSYCLKLEKETYLYENQHRYNLPEENLQRKMYYKMLSILKNNDFFQYEISNFSKKNFQSKHNVFIWEGEEYAGFGPSAHSFYKMQRIENKPTIASYLKQVKSKGNGINQKKEIPKEEYLVDKIILGLRLNKGISLSQFKQEFDVDLQNKYKTIIEKYRKNGYLTTENDRLKLTEKALFLSNSIFSEFI